MPDAKPPAILKTATVKNDDGSFGIEVPSHVTALFELGEYPADKVPEFDVQLSPDNTDAVAWHEIPYAVVRDDCDTPHHRITWMVENYDSIPITLTARPTERKREV